MSRLRPSPSLSRKATSYLAAVALCATAAASPALARLASGTDHVGTFVGLALGAAFAQLFVFELTRSHGFPVAVVFVVAGALILPVQLVALLGLVQHAPDIVLRRFPGYIQTFNVSNYTLDALAAWLVARLVSEHVYPHDRVGWALAGLAAGTAFVALNHLLLATMLRLGRGYSLAESRLFSPESLTIDLVLAALGVALATFTNSNPTLVLTAIAPLILVHWLLRLIAAAEPNQISAA
jgi:hypothetical protein